MVELINAFPSTFDGVGGVEVVEAIVGEPDNDVMLGDGVRCWLVKASTPLNRRWW